MSKPVEQADLLDPHDTCFRQMLSEPKTAMDFVANYLPAPVVELLAQLRIEKDLLSMPGCASTMWMASNLIHKLPTILGLLVEMAQQESGLEMLYTRSATPVVRLQHSHSF